MDVGPRKLWGGSSTKTIRLQKSEKGAANARFALLAAPYLVQSSRFLRFVGRRVNPGKHDRNF